jgi:CBS domain-containing protein
MGFREDIVRETVADLPIREVVSVQPEMTVRTAIEKMRDASLGCAIVVDADGHPQGLFTEQIVLKLLTQGVAIDEAKVGDHAQTEFDVVKSGESIQRVWDAVSRQGARFVCVLDAEEKLIGLTGQRGLAEYISEYFPNQVMVQRLGSKPWMQQREGA